MYAETVRVTFYLSGQTANRICKIGIFGCENDVSTSITEMAWQDPNLVYDLLKDSTATISFPSLTVTPMNCYSTVWTAHNALDNSDITTASYYALESN